MHGFRVGGFEQGPALCSGITWAGEETQTGMSSEVARVKDYPPRHSREPCYGI